MICPYGYKYFARSSGSVITSAVSSFSLKMLELGIDIKSQHIVCHCETLMARKRQLPIKLNLGLSTSFAAALGRVIARHSFLELILAHSLYRILGLDDAVGRIVIGGPRNSEILDRMLQLAKAEGLEFQPFPWNEFKTALDALKRDRDLFAHSSWIYHTKARRYFLYVTRGKTQLKCDVPSNDRCLFPEGCPQASRPYAASEKTSKRRFDQRNF